MLSHLRSSALSMHFKVFTVCLLAASALSATENEVPLNDLQKNVATSLLIDIKNILADTKAGFVLKGEENKDMFLRERIDTITSSLEQRLDLVLTSFATLRQLVQVQSDQLKNLNERFRETEQQCKGITEKFDKLDNKIKVTENSPIQKRETDEVTRGFEETKNRLNGIESKLKHLQKNVTLLTQLDTNLMMADDSVSKVDPSIKHTLGETVSKISKIETKVSLFDDFKKDIQGIKERVEKDGESISRLKSRIDEIDFRKDDVALVKKNFQALLGSLSNSSSAEFLHRTGDALTVSGAGLCVWPYKKGADGCFFVGTDVRLTWDAASDHCRGLQGELATPHNVTAFREFLHKLKVSTGYTYWIGATDLKEEGSWTWLDGRKVDTEDINFHHRISRSRNCLSVGPGAALSFTDAGCNLSRYFVCQQKNYLL